MTHSGIVPDLRVYQADEVSTEWILLAILIDSHGCRGGDVVAKGLTVDGDFDDGVQKTKLFFAQSLPLGADNESGFSLELVLKEGVRVCRLFQSNQRKTVVSELLKNGGQASAEGDRDKVGRISGDFSIHFSGPALDQILDAGATA